MAGLAWAGRARAAPQPFAMAEVAPGLFVRHGVHEDATAANDDAIANIGFIVGDDAVAVIDPGGSRTDGMRLRASIRAVTGRPIRYVILSHMHPDHVFGCEAFTDDNAVVVAHSNMVPALVRRGEFYRRGLADTLGLDEAGDYAAPTLLVDTDHTIDLGNRVLGLHAHGVAHTDNDLSLVDRRTNILWAADLVFVTRVPALDGSILGWLREVALLQQLSCPLAVPGHGPCCIAWPKAAADQQRYLTTLVSEIRPMIAKGAEIEDAVAIVGQGERACWLLFDDYNGRNVTNAFKELEWE